MAMAGVVAASLWSVAQANAQAAAGQGSASPAVPRVIDPASQKHYVDTFNTMEPEKVVNEIPNAQAWDWMTRNVPMFDCPDDHGGTELREIYYFRWWSFRKSIKKGQDGLLGFTEFLEFGPGGSAVGAHLLEARWIHDGHYADQDTTAEVHGGASGIPRDRQAFSSWTIWAAYQRYLVNKDKGFITGLLDDFVKDYQAWELKKQAPAGTYWQYEVRDAMEDSINGDRKAEGRRPSISAYMYGNAMAIASIAELAGKPELASTYRQKAETIRKGVMETLWEPEGKFFKSRWVDGRLSDAREAIGFLPWYTEMVEKGKGYEEAWKQAIDPAGFWAPMGFTTAEMRHPDFRTHGSGHSCEWDGAIWPFTSAQMLTSMANVLNDYPQSFITPAHYFEALRRYAAAQHKDGKPYIGEYQDEVDGRWLRDNLDRGYYYNHSTYDDLVITGLVGLRPRADDIVEVHPLVPANTWDWFCLDRVAYHGHLLTILWDRTGARYGRGAGLTILADGRPIVHAAELGRLTGALP
jgi:hypothetical protein